MFDYIDLDEDKIAGLEESETGARACAGLMILNGYHKGVLSETDALKQINNILVSICITESE
jgi:hypothetical protein